MCVTKYYTHTLHSCNTMSLEVTLCFTDAEPESQKGEIPSLDYR